MGSQERSGGTDGYGTVTPGGRRSILRSLRSLARTLRHRIETRQLRSSRLRMPDWVENRAVRASGSWRRDWMEKLFTPGRLSSRMQAAIAIGVIAGLFLAFVATV